MRFESEDILIAERYQQITEVFGKQHLKQFTSKIASPFSVTASQQHKNITIANKLVDVMKRDAVDDGLAFNKLDPEWVDKWIADTLKFRPSELGLHYTIGANQSKFIQDAMAAKSRSLRKTTPAPASPSPKPAPDVDEDSLDIVEDEERSSDTHKEFDESEKQEADLGFSVEDLDQLLEDWSPGDRDSIVNIKSLNLHIDDVLLAFKRVHKGASVDDILEFVDEMNA